MQEISNFRVRFLRKSAFLNNWCSEKSLKLLLKMVPHINANHWVTIVKLILALNGLSIYSKYIQVITNNFLVQKP